VHKLGAECPARLTAGSGDDGRVGRKLELDRIDIEGQALAHALYSRRRIDEYQ